MQILVLLIALLFCGNASAQDVAPMSKGAYLSRVGDCTSCHTSQGHADFSGGFPVNSPFGIIYGTNITPDATYGIGNYTLEDFTRALRQGIARDGRRLYPAMPYTDFAKISDEDIAALYDYFMHEVPPVAYQPPKTKLPFPFNQRWAIRFWNAAFSPDTRYQSHADKDDQWNRGAYLAQSLGHCGACHTPRGPAYEERGVTETSSHFLHGQTLDNWAAANLSEDAASGLGEWSEEDIAKFLKSGYGHHAIAFGDMTPVIENSTQYMTDTDRSAIAHYLKSLRAEGDPSLYHNAAPAEHYERPNAGLYASSCAGCHGVDGRGRSRAYPALAANAAVLTDDPTSLIHIILAGSVSPQTQRGPKPAKMPAFAKFTDREIADVITFIRQSWGNSADAVTDRQVTRLRYLLQHDAASTTPGGLPAASQTHSSSPPESTK